MQNFHLYYLGAGEANRPDDIPNGVEDAVADGKAMVVSSAWYTINGVPCGRTEAAWHLHPSG